MEPSPIVVGVLFSFLPILVCPTPVRVSRVRLAGFTRWIGGE